VLVPKNRTHISTGIGTILIDNKTFLLKDIAAAWVPVTAPVTTITENQS